MKKYEIVKTQEEFTEIIETGQKLKNNFFNIYIRKNKLGISRFGIAVGKKLGNAVFRNKQKRRIRTILTAQKNCFPKSYDYIIIMKEQGKLAPYQVLEKKLIDLLSKGEKNETTK